MATVTGLTAARMLEIEGASVVDGAVDGNGDLILTRHDGSVVAAGHVKGDPGEKGDVGPKGSAVDLTRPWSHNVGYVVGDVVGYAGRIFKAKRDNLRKAPAFYGADWDVVTAIDTNAWIERDPYFKNVYWQESYEIFWGGGTRTQDLTTVPGEFETGTQALKLTFGANSNSWIYAHDENVVQDGEVIVARVRAKLQAAAPGTLLRGLITQNTPVDNPGPFEPGYSSAEDAGGPQQLTTEWQTYTFVIPVNPGKPRARALILVEAWTNPATVLIDYITYTRSRKFMDRTTQTYIDTTVAPLATKTYVDGLVAGLTDEVALAPITPVSNFNISGKILVETLASGKRRLTVNVQLTRAVANYGVIPSSSWVGLGSIIPVGGRFTPAVGAYFTAWCNVLEGALPISAYLDVGTGAISIKAIPGHTTTMNIGHFATLNVVVNEA